VVRGLIRNENMEEKKVISNALEKKGNYLG